MNFPHRRLKPLITLLLFSVLKGIALADETLTPEDSIFVQQAKTLITRDFKDPGSAQFRNLFISGKGIHFKTLCGEINGKNSYGGYVGYRRFYSSPGAAASFTKIEDGGYSAYDIACGNDFKIRDVP
jgi:Pyridine nucleotide-disulphide oxidoreductase, dimerisation domain/Pyridine nucleotide-disulphide oxidoreductase